MKKEGERSQQVIAELKGFGRDVLEKRAKREDVVRWMTSGVKTDWAAHAHNAVFSGNAEVLTEILRRMPEIELEGPERGRRMTEEEREEERKKSVLGGLRSRDVDYSERMTWSKGWATAAANGHANILKVLRNAGRMGERELGEAARGWASSSRESSEVMEWLIAEGADFSGFDRWDRRQPLTIALNNKFFGKAEELLLRGLHEPRGQAESPLVSAIRANRPDLAEWLLKLGESPNRIGSTTDSVGWGRRGYGRRTLPMVEAARRTRMSGGEWAVDIFLKMWDAGGNPKKLDEAGDSAEGILGKEGFYGAELEARSMEKESKDGMRRRKKMDKKERKEATFSEDAGSEILWEGEPSTTVPAPSARRRRL